MALLAFGLACVAHLAPHRSARPSVAVGHGSRCSAAATAAGAPDGGGGFRALLPSLPAAAAESLSARGIDTPTPIQAAALARIDAGESLLLHAETGSGKSLAFLLPALRHISPRSKLLLIAPTRELAVQLAAEASPLLPAGETVAILSVGSAPAPREVMAASLAASGAVASSLDQALCDLRLVVLDEIDCLLPEKRKAKLARAAAEAAALREARTHPLLRALQCALREQRPASALVFLCRSSGLTRQRELAASFRASAGLHAVDEPAADAGQPAEAPLVVTFEDMARGLHFDGVETVYILGLPDSPATYLHLAGRTGRQPVLSGTVVTLCPGNSHQQLTSWAQRLGGVEFERIELDGLEEALSASA
ncbi:hypothetical protein EMIHUDRAFT_218617 [Emiliania huxleyi CCMP1516]|uniref:DEAD/DEAH box helicase n=2 Tax=Emiliania huxleyi TaxID=2903 RepID=A0A0D3I6M6_EMIH1|nr:hypothetical protein EMIHUDRAFT_218617 [Emiliania huxleyi CCMP1516]EOD06911.1 hypothetical protein EMIHUDRAFT_218617 [Emiliania huxleyi CCMP1516]|eukprot:XP_005759340.1 hypothetical protein EMIHUDRAFT_218617 [Emiliania huxleyi CCMP1516]